MSRYIRYSVKEMKSPVNTSVTGLGVRVIDEGWME